MGHARLKRIKIKGLRSIQTADVKLPDTGLVLIRGQNRETGGSSGSGKTNLLLSPAYALDYCPLPATKLVPWGSKAKPKVTVSLDTHKGELEIERSAGLKLKLGEKKIEGNVPVVKAKLRELIGLPPELLSVVTYRPQKSPGLFLSKGATQKREFLMGLLGLERYEQAVEESRAKIRAKDGTGLEFDVQGDTAALNGRLEELQRVADLAAETLVPLLDLSSFITGIAGFDQAIADTEQDLAKIEAKGKELATEKELIETQTRGKYTDRLAKAEAQIQEAKTALPDVAIDVSGLEKKRALLVEAQTRLSRVQLEQKEAQKVLDAKRSDFQLQLQNAKRDGDELPKLQALVRSLESQLQELQDNRCYTCGQSWHQADVGIAKLQGEITQTRESGAQAQRALTRAEELSSKISDTSWEVEVDPRIQQFTEICSKLTQEAADESAKINEREAMAAVERKAKIADTERAWTELKSEVLEAINQAVEAHVKNLSAHREDYLAVRNKLTELVGKKAELTTELQVAKSKNEAQLSRQEERRLDLERVSGETEKAQAKVEEATRLLNQEKDFVAVTREFLTEIFHEVLSEIAEETNDILGTVPNTAHVTLRFDTEVETGSGKLKKEIRTVLSIGGNESDETGLSGGMESVVELAVDLAVNNVVSRRTGVFPGWLILDEPFTGLGTIELGGCMRILERYAEDKLVLVVDHATEFKEMFHKRLLVEYQGGVSTIGEEIDG